MLIGITRMMMNGIQKLLGDEKVNFQLFVLKFRHKYIPEITGSSFYFAWMRGYYCSSYRCTNPFLLGYQLVTTLPFFPYSDNVCKVISPRLYVKIEGKFFPIP